MSNRLIRSAEEKTKDRIEFLEIEMRYLMSRKNPGKLTVQVYNKYEEEWKKLTNWIED